MRRESQNNQPIYDMKKILFLSLIGLSTFAASANAQILGISIGRHGVGVGVGVPLYTAPPAVVYTPPPAPYYAPQAYYPAPTPYCPAPTVVYSAPSVVIGAYPAWHGYYRYHGYGWRHGGWHR